MALRYMDGFDHYSTAGVTNYIYSISPSLWTKAGTGSDVSGSNRIIAMPVLGGLGLNVQLQGGTTVTKSALLLPMTVSSGTTVGIGFHFYYTNIPDADSKMGIIGLSAGSTLGLSLGIEISGQVTLRGAGATWTSLGTTGTNQLATGTLYHLEWKVFCHATAGTAELRVNGATWMTVTGINTLPVTPTSLYFGPNKPTGGAGTTVGVFDNLFIWDGSGSINNNFLGERNVETLFPNADTATAGWTKSTGTDGFDLINDVPAVDATRYIESSAVSDQSTFALSNLSSTNVAVTGVQTVIRGQKTAAAASEVQFGIISNSNSDLSASTAMTQAQFQHFAKVHELDPNGGIAWTPSAVNALQSTVVRSV